MLDEAGGYAGVKNSVGLFGEVWVHRLRRRTCACMKALCNDEGRGNIRAASEERLVEKYSVGK